METHLTFLISEQVIPLQYTIYPFLLIQEMKIILYGNIKVTLQEKYY